MRMFFSCCSFLAHKEFRFIHPILPLSMHYCGVYFKALCRKPRLKRKKHKSVEGKDTDSAHGYSSSESLVSSTSTEDSQGTSLSTDSHKDSGIDSASALPVVDEVIDGKENEDRSRELTKHGNADPIPLDPLEKQRAKHKYNLTKAKVLVVILVLTNIPAALYFGLIHQRGTTVVMKYLYDESEDKSMDVMFLMPCHSTPYYRYFVLL